MIQKAYPSADRGGTALGADLGATLVKLALRGDDGRTEFELVPAHAIERVAQKVERARPGRVGLTGGGAPGLAALLGRDTAPVNEFEAWASGAGLMLGEAGLDPSEPYLLVSLGTGTSAMLVGRESVSRVGGTALGGGTVVGLGAALTGASSFDELTALAREGDRRRVDLLVSDIYRSGELPLPGDLNASSFGKLARSPRGGKPEARDLAHAVMGLVGENVALICCGLAAAAGVKRVVFGGATLRGNGALLEILQGLTGALGREGVFLPQGEFAGALGALELAQ